MNINSDAGFALAVLCILRLVQGGLAFFACQCSSWVWMSRASTGRSPSNPTGNEAAPSVIQGNASNNRCAILCVLCHKIGAFWAVEQPGSSLFFETDDMKMAINACSAAFTKFKMKIFGHPSDKFTLVCGTVTWLSKLSGAGRPPTAATSSCSSMQVPSGPPALASSSSTPDGPVRPARRPRGKANAKAQPKLRGLFKPKGKAVTLVRSETKRDGTQAVNGDKVALKDSQVYPVRFALAVVRLHWPHLLASSR